MKFGRILIHRNKYDYVIMVVIMAGILFGPFAFFKIFGIAFFLYYAMFKRIKDIRRLCYFFAFFMAYSVVAALWTPDWHEYFAALRNSVVFIGYFLCIYYSSTKARRPVQSVLYGWVMLTVIHLCIGFWEISTIQHFDSGSFQADNQAVTMGGGWV